MTKSEFLGLLENELKDIPDYERAIDYYREIIEDRMEDGTAEEDAVAGLDSIDTIRNRLIGETPLPALINAKVSKPISSLNVVLLIVGFPVWFSLLIAAGAVVFALFVTTAALVFSFFLLVFTLAIGGVAVFIAAFFHLGTNVPYGVLNIGASMMMIGGSILLINPALRFGQKSIEGAKWSLEKIKSLFIRKGGNP